MTEGATSTLRANALGVVATLPGRANAELVVQVLEEDDRVRRLCLASDISRLTQVDWPTALRLANDLHSVPKPKRLAAKAAKEAVDPKDTESRWCGAYMLRKLPPSWAVSAGTVLLGAAPRPRHDARTHCSPAKKIPGSEERAAPAAARSSVTMITAWVTTVGRVPGRVRC